MKESSLWMWQIIAGVVILIFLGLHMIIMHLDSILAAIGIGYTDPLSAKSVLMRSREAFYMITYIILLGAALYHALYGLRNILFELSLSRTGEQVVNWTISIFGLALFVYGTYVSIAIFVQ